MRTLLVTGRLLGERVKEISKRLEGYDVFIGDCEVAACMSSKLLVSYIKDKNYDMILVPGTVGWDLNKVEEESGARIFKGPKDIADLEFVLENVNVIELSKETPACELLNEKMRTKALQEISEVDSKKYREGMLKKSHNILVGDLPVGSDFPIRVLAEIVDATRLKTEDLKNRAEYFISSGADIIDIGVNEKDPDGVEGAIETLKGYNIPLSIDTMDEQNIKRALDLDIDMVMSFDHRLLKRFNNLETPIVIIPKKRTVPKDCNKKIQILEENIRLAKTRGFKNIIADLILEPINFGFTDSVAAYKIFSDRNKIPMLLGVGNVTELMDADSVGINALLSGIAMECNVGIVFTPEHSDKTKGSTNELATSSKMMYLTKKRGSKPKDLGLDLLCLKDKHFRREEFKEGLYDGVRIVQAKLSEGHEYDPKDYFKIFVEKEIKAVYYKKEKPKFVITGASAKEVSDTIFSMTLVSDMSHAFYLGRELEKAEVALKTGKSYVQDMGVF